MEHLGFWEGIARDLTGKGQVRLIVQPLMAIILGIRLGMKDARAGSPPFLLRLFTEAGRGKLLKQSLSDVMVPLALAFGLDLIFQYLTLGRVRPLAAVVVGALLVWLPFAIARALTNRFWKRRQHQRTAHAT
jgi:hypothetical protein